MSTRPMEQLLQVMARLRDPKNGCPWDMAQTFQTIAPYTIEEAYEVADAIERGDRVELRDELGDLLFQVVFHTRLAEEAGDFDFDAVAQAIVAKMVRRHPHVFAGETVTDVAAQSVQWEDIKSKERENSSNGAAVSALDGVATSLPGVTRAVKLQRRAARVGFDWPALAPVVAKLREEVEELEAAVALGEAQSRVDEEFGDLMFSLLNVARHLDLDPDASLRRANIKFERRFRAMEELARSSGETLADLAPEQREALWEVSKDDEATDSPN